MYAVIFRAEIRELDEQYHTMATQLRTLAMEKYGCQEFIACTEGECEIAISYWNSLEQIEKWKSDKLHVQAQALGKKKWYRNYQVQVTEIIQR